MQTPNQPEVSSLRFIVLQLGARMHYAVPTFLAQAGILEHFYTDISSNVAILQKLVSLWPKNFRPKPLKRLLGRQVPSVISPDLVTTCTFSSISNYLINKSKINKIFQKKLINIEKQVFKKVIKDKFFNANVIYTNFINSDLDVIRQAKAQGISIVHEVIINPEIPYILYEERDRYPGIELQDPLDEIKHGTSRDREKWSLSDLILVPSPYVRDSIIKMGGDPQRIALVPYGISDEWLRHSSEPQPGRVLCVGTVGLLKGNHYLAAATRLLQQQNIKCQVRVAGPYNKHTIRHDEFQGPQYIGQVPRAEIQHEFAQADLFVLPTLCDSFALVQLEALAYGLPIITTPNCGSIVRDGIEGFIVPIRNSQMLADRIEQLVTDRDLRDEMSQNARQRAQDFTWDCYRKQLFQALEKLDYLTLK